MFNKVKMYKNYGTAFVVQLIIQQDKEIIVLTGSKSLLSVDVSSLPNSSTFSDGGII